jgi:hypothetical protein
MEQKKSSNTVKWGTPIKLVKSDFAKLLDNDPFFIKKWDEAIKAMEENPPPEWILKRMRGED